MKVHTFIGKSCIEGLHLMDGQINEWLARNHVVPVDIRQSTGSMRQHGANEEPVVVVSVWYEPENAEIK